jgi:RimJ/RimL family protein N-acetyltransferase
MIDLQPQLCGERFRLRPLAHGDWDELFGVAADPLIWEQHPAPGRCQAPVFRRFFDDALASGGALIVADASDRIIGSSRFNFDPATPDQVEIGWTFLAREYWGCGANHEIKRMMLRHAFQFLDTVFFRVGEANFRSRKAMEKIGGVLADRRETIHLPGGEPAVHVVYEINKDQFCADC